MLKRISIQHLTLGMYLHDFCGSWMDHPFWRAKFVLKDPKDLARIKDTAIEEVWIDISKGLDVAAGVRSISREEADIKVETDFSIWRTCPPWWSTHRTLRPPPPAARHAARHPPACTVNCWRPPRSVVRPSRPWSPCSGKRAWARP